MRIALPRRMAFSVSNVAVLTTLAGCATPTVAVRSAAVEQTGADAVRLAVELELANPASNPMRLLQWNYTFQAGSVSYHGTWEALAVLPPDRVPVVLRLPCVVPVAGFDHTVPWSISGQLTYRSPSRLAEIGYDLGIIRPSTGFSGGAAGIAATPAPASTAASSTSPSDSTSG